MNTKPQTFFLLTSPAQGEGRSASPTGSSIFDLPTHPGKSTRGTPTRNPSGEEISNAKLAGASAAATDAAELSDPSFVIISGGTGCNAICSAFSKAYYVLPVSDDGGSSSEIIRVLGGPSIGDIRSRLVRLIPPAPAGSPLDALRTLLAYRLPAGAAARDEWRAIVEGRSPLWNGIPSDRKETIRGFLVYFENEVLRRAHKSFSFVNGSIGNYFLAAAQGFFRSLPSAIFLFSSITSSQANILPVIVTNHTVTIAAELSNGAKLIGQCDISHPVPRITLNSLDDTQANEQEEDAEYELDVMYPTSDADGEVGQGPVLPRRQNVMFSAASKDSHEEEQLEAPISRLYYINSYGHEIHPSPNPEYIKSLATNEVLVYSCGSLWTSIIPCLALRGVSNAIARSPSLRAKILFLNSKNDRETPRYKAQDYIEAIARTLNARYQVEPYGLARGNAATSYPVSAFITHLVYLNGPTVSVDENKITDMGVRCLKVESSSKSESGTPLYDAECARRAVEESLGSAG